MARRILLSLVTAVLTLLLVEGGLSLLGGTSLRELLRKDEGPGFLRSDVHVATDADRFQGGAFAGPYVAADDPYVGIVLRPESELTMAGATVHTDRLGLRAPTARDPEWKDADVRITVLGDSIAFGYGVADDEVLAAQLERFLREARGPDAPTLACRTVAVPGWNFRNAFTFLRSRWDELASDLVLFMPVMNDLDDSFTAYENGLRRFYADPGVEDPLLHVFQNVPYLGYTAGLIQQRGGEVAQEDVGPSILRAGITRESRRRLDEMAAAIGDGARFVRANGGELCVLTFAQHEVLRLVKQRWVRDGANVREIALFERLREDDRLPDDPHPNAETLRVMARWTAESLIEEGLVSRGAGRPLPAVPAAFRGRRTKPLERDELDRWCATFLDAQRAALRPVMRHATLEGMCQVYGGLNTDGSLGPSFLAALPAGRELRVTLEPLEGRPDLYPLAIEVRVNGERVGQVEVEDGRPSSATFPLAGDATREPLEVHLSSRRWAVVSVLGRSRTAVARFVSLESAR